MDKWEEFFSHILLWQSLFVSMSENGPVSLFLDDEQKVLKRSTVLMT